MTSLGDVAAPKEPIGGYVYGGGAGAGTVWRLHAEAVYIQRGSRQVSCIPSLILQCCCEYCYSPFFQAKYWKSPDR